MSGTTPFGEMLRGLRLRARFTMEELAEASGVSARAISDMERGHSRTPRRRTVSALADGLELLGVEREALLAALRGARPAGPATGVGLPPRAVGDFTGRGRELALLAKAADLVGSGHGRAVTVLSGPPGCGKTTLALKAAADLAPTFPDGCVVVDLHGVVGPVDPGEALVRVLKNLAVPQEQITEEDEAGRAGLLRALLAERQCLVVLDNARDEAQVRSLLPPRGGRSLALVTSRRPLTGLEDVDRLALAELPREEAVELLRRILGAERADAEPEAVLRVAELCGCLPLALRVAGNWLIARSGWSVDHLLRRLADEERRLSALTAGDVRVEAAFELSYRQLTDQAAGMLRLLSLVPGPDFTAAYGAALTGTDVLDAEDVLEELVEAGLLQAAHTGRYQLHDLIRLFARARLSEREPGQARTAEDRLVDWLLETATAAGRWFTPQSAQQPSPRQGLVPLESREQAQAWLENETTAWVAGLRRVAERGEYGRVVEAVEAMEWSSGVIAHRVDWVEVYRLSCQAAAALEDPWRQAFHLQHHAWALTHQGRRHREAVERAREAFEHARRIQDPTQQAWALRWAARGHRHLGDLQASADAALAATELFETVGKDVGWLQAVSAYGTALRGLGRIEEALAQRRRILAFLDDPDCPMNAYRAEMERAKTTSLMGEDFMALGRWREAVDLLRAGTERMSPLGYPAWESQALASLGEALIQLGETDQARACLERALSFGETAFRGTREKARHLLESIPAQ